MLKTSRKETAAIIAVTIAFGVVLIGLIVKSIKTASEPGITLRETFAQPPGGPLPGRPATTPVPAITPTPSDSSSGATPNSAAASHTVPSGSPVNPPPTVEGGSAASPPVSSSPVNEIVVHVAGAVKKPGVYHLPAGARNDDAIEKAGGPTLEANTDGINLASRVEDGSQLYLPTRKQHPEGGADAPTTTATAAPISPVSSPSAKSNSKASAKTSSHTVAKSTSGAKGGKSGKFTDPSQGTVNINTASAEELQRIPGIGPAMAERILDFRKTNGKFSAAEDMLQISGIGEKKFAKMQPFVRVR